MAYYLPILSVFILVFSFLPLLNKIIKNRSVSGVSLLMMTFGLAQSVYFISYNLYFARFYIALPFFATGLLSGLILYFFARYNAAKRQKLQLLGMLSFSLLPFLLLLNPNLDTATVLNGLTYVGTLADAADVRLDREAFANACQFNRTVWIRRMVGRGGLEPPTSRLSGVRSNHLSYRPKSRPVGL